MFFYQIVFNRPITPKNDVGSFTYSFETMLPVGIRVLAEFGSALLNGVIVEQTTQLEEVYAMQSRGIIIKNITKIIDTTPILTEQQIALAQWMAEYYICSLGESIFTIVPSTAKKEKTAVFSETIISHHSETIHTLTDEQQQCIKTIDESYNDEHIKMCYLYGITGSGKTEVFLSCIKTMLEKNKAVLYLVPEITLVQQCYPFFCKRFGKEHIAILHSHLTGSEKLKEWNRILSGEAKLILGVRSAIFAPVSDLGLIIIDEEHDASYKSSTTPRYHARQVAMKVSLMHNALLVMGSATPSVEAWAYKDNASMKFMYLKHRVAGGSLPHIELISLVNTIGCISPLLQDAMKTTLKQNKQVLLLLNRRGFSPMLLCTQCGEIIACPHCSVNLTIHRDMYDNGNGEHSGSGAQNLLCHHCGYNSAVPQSCPKCNFIGLGSKGWGIQKVEEEIKTLFPNISIGRLDSDIAKDKTKFENILQRFYNNEIKIMVGTQILAKGINIPNIQLVGVLFADALLGIPDFRAEENAFSLITQVSGRAGRFFENAKVIIQGYGIEKNLFKNIKNRETHEFYNEELSKRKICGLAPYKRILRLVFRGMKEESVMVIAEKTHETLEEYIKNNALSCDILGPSPCVLEKLSNNYRYHILLAGHTQMLLNQICRAVLFGGIKTKSNAKKVYIEIDIDPIHIY